MGSCTVNLVIITKNIFSAKSGHHGYQGLRNKKRLFFFSIFYWLNTQKEKIPVTWFADSLEEK